MADLRLFGSTSNLIRFTLKNSTTGQPLTGLTGSSSGLIISTIADVESSATAYTQAATHIQTISTLGTFAAPSASNCRFGEVDSTNHPGLYEFQIADARFAVTNAKRLIVSVSGAASLLAADYEIELVQFNPFDGVHLGLTSLPNTAVTTNGSLITSGTGTAQLNTSSGHVANVDTLTTYTGNTPQTGDTYARIGAPAGANLAADVAAVKSDTATILTDVNTGGGAIYTRIGAPVGASISADIAAVKAKLPTGIAASGIQKNTALANFPFAMKSGNAPAIGVTITGQVSIDAGAYTNLTNTATIHEVGNGCYTINLAAADLNGLAISLKFTAPGADQTDVKIITSS